MRRTAALFGLLALALAGCRTLGPNYQRPALNVPDQHRGQAGAAEAASLADQPWWDVFRDDALKGLIAEGLRNGYDVRLAAWRVEEARANAGIIRSQVFPAFQGSVEIGRGRQSGQDGSLLQANVNASWEIDLWGRIRRSNEAALAQYLASEEARRGIYLALVSEIATDYFQLRQLDLQLEIARRTSGAFQETFDLFDRRLRGGAASALETTSAQALLASTSATIPD